MNKFYSLNYSIQKLTDSFRRLHYKIDYTVNDINTFSNFVSAYNYKSWWERIKYWLSI
jgi:hypothetical protein